MGATTRRQPPEKEYFNYSNADVVCFDVEHLSQTLCISEVGDSAVILLNPMVVWSDGEWETWFFANWLPGARRYHSFGDWMRNQLAEKVDEHFEHTNQPGQLPTVYLDPPGKTKRRIRAREQVLDLPSVLKALNSQNSRRRYKSVQQLERIGGDRAVAALISALKKDPDRNVRCEAAEALGRLGAPMAVDALIESINDEGVNTTAIHALAGFVDEKSAECLLQILEQGGYYATSAVSPLSKRSDARAVGHLINFLISKDPRDNHIGNIAGRLAAEFGEAGLIALEPLVRDHDSEIRRRAIIGVGDIAFADKNKMTKEKARKLMRECLETEADPDLRSLIETEIQITSEKRAS